MSGGEMGFPGPEPASSPSPPGAGDGPDRRAFLRRSVAGLGALALGLVPAPGRGLSPRVRPARDRPVRPADDPLRILILGGTGFIGPHQVRYARARGHRITLFNRGKTNPHLFPDVEKLRGDRNGDLESLEGRSWDVVIDNSASDYRWVEMSADLLADAVEQYIYVSSISAYADLSRPGVDEDDPTHSYRSAGVEPGAEELPYGLQKALCEREAREALPGRTTVVRPGLIVGPRDRTDRFTYWPARIDRGGEVLAPGTPEDPTQLIDARDLTGWMIRLAEAGTTGTFNATGPTRGMGVLLAGIREAVRSDATLTWVDADFLAEHGVQPWTDMPVWMPPRGQYAGIARADIGRALEAGLTFRPLAETARDTLRWHRARPPEEQRDLRAGLDPDREAEVLQAWHARES